MLVVASGAGRRRPRGAQSPFDGSQRSCFSLTRSLALWLVRGTLAMSTPGGMMWGAQLWGCLFPGMGLM